MVREGTYRALRLGMVAKEAGTVPIRSVSVRYLKGEGRGKERGGIRGRMRGKEGVEEGEKRQCSLFGSVAFHFFFSSFFCRKRYSPSSSLLLALSPLIT